MTTRIDILSGFLGAGKTTLLLKLFECPPKDEKIAICENEYGEVGIDGKIFHDRDIAVMEVNAGCVCCTLSGNLIAGLKLLIAQSRPDRILLEPSGLANLAEILNILRDDGLEKLAYVGTPAAVLDGSAFLGFYEKYRLYFDTQLGSADVVFLNRTESLRGEECLKLAELISQANPQIKILAEPYRAEEAWQALSGPYEPSVDGWGELPKTWLSSFRQAAVQTGFPGSRERLGSFMDSPLAAGLVRAKGYVRDHTGARFRVDYAGGRWAFVPDDGRSRDVLQLIGRNLPLFSIKSYFRFG